MSTKERRKERKKDSIRRAALELFRELGFEKVSLNDIARRAGVSHVTIYNYFGNREELIRDVIKFLTVELMEKYRAILKEDKPFGERLEEIVLDKADIAGQFQGELLQSVLKSDPEIQKYLDEVYRGEVHRMIREFFEEGKNEGYISKDISFEAYIMYMEILRTGLYTRTELAESIEHSPKLVKELMSLIVYGLNG